MIFESIINYMSYSLTCCVLIDFKRPIQNILPYLDQQRLGRDQELTRLLVGVFLLSSDLPYENIFDGLPRKYLRKLSTKFNKIFPRILSRLTKNVTH